MFLSDLSIIYGWWFLFFLIGVIFLPLTIRIFSDFFDAGYIFSKILGIGILGYVIFVLGTIHLVPFNRFSSTVILFLFFLISLSFNFSIKKGYLVISKKIIDVFKNRWKIFLFEEILFTAALIFWTFIRAHQPDIQGLEKFMDFGFINSILRGEYFPAKDMWFTPFSINYYYFGHLVTAVLTKISNIPSNIAFNLMMSSIFAFTFVGSFSIGANLIYFLISKLEIRNPKQYQNTNSKNSKHFGNSIFENLNLLRYSIFDIRILLGGFLTAFLVTLAGNLQTIYTLFKPYENENPMPFWQLTFSPGTFPNSYWYPNATRFIYHTIHEFPIYSWVVSDLHGHVLDIPFVLLTIALLLSVFLGSDEQAKKFNRFKIYDLRFKILLGFLLAIMYMTNAWDGVIYLLLSAIILAYMQLTRIKQDRQKNTTNNPILQILPIKNLLLKHWLIDFFIGLFVYLFILGVLFYIFSLPFQLFFKPFVSGIGVLCAPEFLVKIGRLGPFIFEANHCQSSPLWQLGVLYGFFYFFAISFVVYLKKLRKIHSVDWFILILITFSTFLIIIPEFIYVKDIYPEHYRANTMFKLVYQSFIMLSVSSAYIILRILPQIKSQILKQGIWIKLLSLIWLIFTIILLFFVSIYPYYSIASYYADVKNYKGLNGTKYLGNLYPNDYQAILWINQNIKNQPVILEAQGDSYTDYARVSANTGLPTVLGWTVHEWLWRGTYDIPAPRIEEVKTLFETNSIETAKYLLDKYDISLVFIGDLEKEKYPNLNEEKFKDLGELIYAKGTTRIYQINL